MKYSLKHLALIVFILGALHGPAWAEVPAFNQSLLLPNNTHSWRVEKDTMATTLVIAEVANPQSFVRHDLSDCLFCVGEEDNCQQDGIFPLSYGEGQQKAALGVVCHVGAHSQRFQVFLPARNMTAPVFDVTGNYFVTTQIVPGGVRVEYDGDAGEQFTRYWPAKPPSHAPVGTRKRAAK